MVCAVLRRRLADLLRSYRVERREAEIREWMNVLHRCLFTEDL